MARWEPDARGRLTTAAMELFQEAGYTRTTVEQIAARAGLTERTFFRYFADKREVLFSGSKALEKTIVDGIRSAPATSTPLDAVVAALATAAGDLEALHAMDYVRARYALVTTHADLQERELIKLAALGAAMAKALHARGVAEPAASLAAEAGIAVFKIGFERWVKGRKPSRFASHIHAAVHVLRSVAAETQPAEAPAKKRAARRPVARKQKVDWSLP